MSRAARIAARAAYLALGLAFYLVARALAH